MLSLKGPRDASFAEIRADVRGTPLYGFRFKSQAHFAKREGHHGVETRYLHERAWDARGKLIQGAKTGFFFHAAKGRDDVWRYAHDVRELGARRGDVVSCLVGR